MSRRPNEPSPPEPKADAALAGLRDGLERAHELVAEAKLAMRQLGDEQPSPSPEGAKPRL